MDINQALRTSITDLDKINPWWGLLRFSILGFLFLSLITLAWLQTHLITFISLTAIAGIIYSFWLVCTHDTAHYTLTGWRWFEEIFPRLISWPMLWPYGIYSETHILHHAWNGRDLRDPERVQWTLEEYQKENKLLRWYIRNQIIIDIFMLGGLGVIFKTFAQGWHLRSFRPNLTKQIALDIGGIILIHSSLLFVALHYECLGRYLLFWLILERTIGIIMQIREHLEHYGYWDKQENHLLTQLYGARNLKVNNLTQWLMGGLPYHSIHHGFPNLPFNQLPEAFNRIQSLLIEYQYSPLPLGEGYIKETLFLNAHPTLIDVNQEKIQNVSPPTIY